jgi:hypothetical protein
MVDAIIDCQGGCFDCNDDPVHAWDEAVAFYAGSLEPVDMQPGSGKLLYALADKRCKNFKTCIAQPSFARVATGVSHVNYVIVDLFKKGKTALRSGQCSAVPAIRDRIIQQMVVPLIQGSLRYAYKVDKLQGGTKEKAEGAVFSAAILPMIAHCSSASAATISSNMAIEVTTKMKDGFGAVKQAFEETYTCLGITCAEVGGLLQSNVEVYIPNHFSTAYYPGAEPCQEFTSIVSYVPGSNVVQHSRIDLCQKEMETHLGKNPADFANAKKIYEIGGHSGAYARLTLSPTTVALEQGVEVTQAGNSNARGYVK